MIADSERENASPLDARRALLQRYLRGEAAPVAAARIPARTRADRAPLTAGQRQLWLLSQLIGDVPVYNEALTVRIQERLNVIALQQALDEIVMRHEAWRTTFVVENGGPVQAIHPIGSLTLDQVDLRPVPYVRREARALRLARDHACQPFDLAAEPPLRALLVCLGETEYRLFLTFHHIIFDGMTVQSVLVPELIALYRAFENSAPSPLRELPVQYGDYAYWQEEEIASERVQRQIAYWEKQLAGDLPTLMLPSRSVQLPAEPYRGATRYLRLSPRLSEAIKHLSQGEGATPFMILLTAFGLLLRRFAGQDDLIVGTVVSTRDRSELEALAGYFLNTVALRIDTGEDPSVQDLIRQVRAVVLAAFAHQDVPFELLVRRLHPDRSRGKNPLFQVMMTLDPPAAPLDANWSLTRMDVDTGTAKFDLGLYLSDTPDGFVGRFEYSLEVLDEATVVRMMEHFQHLLWSMVTESSSRVSQLPSLTGEEGRLLREWNATNTDFPATIPVPYLVTAQAQWLPNVPAVCDEHSTITYSELERRANQLAHALRIHGAGPTTPVAVFLDRSVEMVIGLLAVLKSGAAYIPLDPAYPSDRIEYILVDSRASVLLTQERLLPSLPEAGARTLCIDRDREEIQAQPDSEPDVVLNPDSLAYIIYTSGSTGNPKGVEVMHRNVSNLLSAVQRRLVLAERDVMLAVTSPAFDIHVTELFLPLIAGACIEIADRDIVVDARALMVRASQRFVTHMQATPALWRSITETSWPPKKPMTVLSAGEALSPELAERLLEGASELWNFYGPTETTVYSTAHLVQAGDNPIPIGRPIDNTQTYILDRDQQPVPPGVTGELYIGGAGVTRGYAGRPDLTAERFVPDPINPLSATRVYRTGDLCRWRDDGTIEYLGRNDHQVKVRGYRIELGEVELALRSLPMIGDAVVVTNADQSGEQQLVAYVTPRGAIGVSGKDVRVALQAILPSYMTPAVIVPLAALPLTPNGKIDRLALPAPEQPPDRTGYVAPRTPTEERLVSIWSQILGLERVGVHDDFFDLGGHSLLAVQLLERIRVEYGRSIPLSTLFTGATIENVERALLSPKGTNSEALLIPVQPKGVRRPFFFLHGQPLGRGLYSLKLARILGQDRPFHVFQPHALAGQKVPDSIEKMAGDYIDALRVIQPQGPYRIGGFCLSGFIAYEMAQQLLRQGEEIELLVLLHTRLPTFLRSSVIRAALDTAGPALGVDGESRLAWYSALLDARETFAQLAGENGGTRRAAGDVFRRWRDRKSRTGFRGELPRQRGMDPYLWALARYTFRPYPGRLTLLRASAESEPDDTNGWGRLAAEVVAYEVPGHSTVLREEVDVLGIRLTEILDGVDA